MGRSLIIERVFAWEALDSRGQPTVACVVGLPGGGRERPQCSRAPRPVAAEAALDGFYVLRTSLGEDVSAQAVVRAYKQLAAVERAFRAMKAHNPLAYAVRIELEERLAELLFVDDAPLAPADPVAPARRSQAASAKRATKRTAGGLPASSFRDLLDALASLTRNRIRLARHDVAFDQLAEQTPLQRRAFSFWASTRAGCSQKRTAAKARIPLRKRDPTGSSAKNGRDAAPPAGSKAHEHGVPGSLPERAAEA